MKKLSAWAILVATVLAACAKPASETDQQRAERLAREHMSDAVGAAALERSQVEARPSACGWMVVFRDADARCGEAPFWPGACRFGPAVYRDVYACVGHDWTIRQVGGSQSPQPLGAEDQCQCAPSSTATVAPEPTAAPVTLAGSPQ